MNRPLTLLLADDHALVRAGLRAILAQQPDLRIVAEAADGHEVLDAVGRHRPDVLLLDISMPGLNGLEAIPQVRAASPTTQVVVLSMHGAEEYVARAYRSGALGYLTKDAPPGELVQAVRAAGEGRHYYTAEHSERQVAGYLGQGAGLGAPTALERLTPREREVLQLLSEGHPVADIARRLSISPKTVETHRANLCAKLGLYDVASLTRFALRAGITSNE